MITKLTRIGDDVVLVVEKPLLDHLGLDDDSEVELSTDGHVLVITPKRDPAREASFRKAMDRIDRKYAGVFERLSKS